MIRRPRLAWCSGRGLTLRSSPVLLEFSNGLGFVFRAQFGPDITDPGLHAQRVRGPGVVPGEHGEPITGPSQLADDRGGLWAEFIPDPYCPEGSVIVMHDDHGHALFFQVLDLLRQ